MHQINESKTCSETFDDLEMLGMIRILVNVIINMPKYNSPRAIRHHVSRLYAFNGIGAEMCHFESAYMARSCL